jgi:hypothetical protein
MGRKGLVIATAEIMLIGVVLLALATGLLVLWRWGPTELDAWGRYVSRILHGDQLK